MSSMGVMILSSSTSGGGSLFFLRAMLTLLTASAIPGGPARRAGPPRVTPFSQRLPPLPLALYLPAPVSRLFTELKNGHDIFTLGSLVRPENHHVFLRICILLVARQQPLRPRFFLVEITLNLRPAFF